MRILVVEDEPSLLKAIAKRLQEEGYAVDSATDGESAMSLVEMIEYDCIILDLMIPVMDGMTFLKRLRDEGKATPVLILTAIGDVSVKVKGLDMGADDYLTKPFSFDELLARVRALLRRTTENRETVLRVGDLVLDTSKKVVMRGGRVIELTAKEYAILEYLMRNKGQVLTKLQILDHVWNYDFEYSSNIVEVYIRYLRRKIDDGFEKKLIHTVRGIGYTIREQP
ncbi:MAG: response regulator transcription factor [Synergistetes bacterium]|nr:response regulator transcription factor [Synergistota bacterium]